MASHSTGKTISLSIGCYFVCVFYPLPVWVGKWLFQPHLQMMYYQCFRFVYPFCSAFTWYRIPAFGCLAVLCLAGTLWSVASAFGFGPARRLRISDPTSGTSQTPEAAEFLPNDSGQEPTSSQQQGCPF